MGLGKTVMMIALLHTHRVKIQERKITPIIDKPDKINP
jgi:hypothetical protein